MHSTPARFTLRLMMTLVSSLALGLALIRHAVTHWGAGEVMTIAPIVLLATNILAWLQKARWQVFWAGFGLCGWAYLSFSLGSPLAEHLPTERLLGGLHDRLYPNPPASAVDDGFDDGRLSLQEHADAFKRAGQSIFGLVFALMGGSAAIILFPGRGKGGEIPTPPDGSLLTPGWRDRDAEFRKPRS